MNLFVAGFIGSPAMNLITARLEGAEAVFGNSRLELPARPGLSAYDGREVVVGIRPEDFSTGGDGALELTVNRLESLGSELVAYLDSGQPGAEITARLERRADVEEGRPARLSVDRERFYFFDPETGQAVE